MRYSPLGQPYVQVPIGPEASREWEDLRWKAANDRGDEHFMARPTWDERKQIYTVWDDLDQAVYYTDERLDEMGPSMMNTTKWRVLRYGMPYYANRAWHGPDGEDVTLTEDPREGGRVKLSFNHGQNEFHNRFWTTASDASKVGPDAVWNLWMPAYPDNRDRRVLAIVEPPDGTGFQGYSEMVLLDERVHGMWKWEPKNGAAAEPPPAPQEAQSEVVPAAPAVEDGPVEDITYAPNTDARMRLATRGQNRRQEDPLPYSNRFAVLDPEAPAFEPEPPAQSPAEPRQEPAPRRPRPPPARIPQGRWLLYTPTMPGTDPQRWRRSGVMQLRNQGETEYVWRDPATCGLYIMRKNPAFEEAERNFFMVCMKQVVAESDAAVKALQLCRELNIEKLPDVRLDIFDDTYKYGLRGVMADWGRRDEHGIKKNLKKWVKMTHPDKHPGARAPASDANESGKLPEAPPVLQLHTHLNTIYELLEATVLDLAAHEVLRPMLQDGKPVMDKVTGKPKMEPVLNEDGTPKMTKEITEYHWRFQEWLPVPGAGGRWFLSSVIGDEPDRFLPEIDVSPMDKAVAAHKASARARQTWDTRGTEVTTNNLPRCPRVRDNSKTDGWYYWTDWVLWRRHKVSHRLITRSPDIPTYVSQDGWQEAPTPFEMARESYEYHYARMLQKEREKQVRAAWLEGSTTRDSNRRRRVGTGVTFYMPTENVSHDKIHEYPPGTMFFPIQEELAKELGLRLALASELKKEKNKREEVIKCFATGDYENALLLMKITLRQDRLRIEGPAQPAPEQPAPAAPGLGARFLGMEGDAGDKRGGKRRAGGGDDDGKEKRGRGGRRDDLDDEKWDTAYQRRAGKKLRDEDEWTNEDYREPVLANHGQQLTAAEQEQLKKYKELKRASRPKNYRMLDKHVVHVTKFRQERHTIRECLRDAMEFAREHDYQMDPRHDEFWDLITQTDPDKLTVKMYRFAMDHHIQLIDAKAFENIEEIFIAFNHTVDSDQYARQFLETAANMADLDIYVYKEASPDQETPLEVRETYTLRKSIVTADWDKKYDLDTHSQWLIPINVLQYGTDEEPRFALLLPWKVIVEDTIREAERKFREERQMLDFGGLVQVEEADEANETAPFRHVRAVLQEDAKRKKDQRGNVHVRGTTGDILREFKGTIDVVTLPVWEQEWTNYSFFSACRDAAVAKWLVPADRIPSVLTFTREWLLDLWEASDALFSEVKASMQGMLTPARVIIGPMLTRSEFRAFVRGFVDETVGALRNGVAPLLTPLYLTLLAVNGLPARVCPLMERDPYERGPRREMLRFFVLREEDDSLVLHHKISREEKRSGAFVQGVLVIPLLELEIKSPEMKAAANAHYIDNLTVVERVYHLIAAPDESKLKDRDTAMKYHKANTRKEMKKEGLSKYEIEDQAKARAMEAATHVIEHLLDRSYEKTTGHFLDMILDRVEDMQKAATKKIAEEAKEAAAHVVDDLFNKAYERIHAKTPEGILERQINDLITEIKELQIEISKEQTEQAAHTIEALLSNAHNREEGNKEDDWLEEVIKEIEEIRQETENRAKNTARDIIEDILERVHEEASNNIIREWLDDVIEKVKNMPSPAEPSENDSSGAPTQVEPSNAENALAVVQSPMEIIMDAVVDALQQEGTAPAGSTALLDSDTIYAKKGVSLMPFCPYAKRTLIQQVNAAGGLTKVAGAAGELIEVRPWDAPSRWASRQKGMISAGGLPSFSRLLEIQIALRTADRQREEGRPLGNEIDPKLEYFPAIHTSHVVVPQPSREPFDLVKGRQALMAQLRSGCAAPWRLGDKDSDEEPPPLPVTAPRSGVLAAIFKDACFTPAPGGEMQGLTSIFHRSFQHAARRRRAEGDARYRISERKFRRLILRQISNAWGINSLIDPEDERMDMPVTYEALKILSRTYCGPDMEQTAAFLVRPVHFPNFVVLKEVADGQSGVRRYRVYMHSDLRGIQLAWDILNDERILPEPKTLPEADDDDEAMKIEMRARSQQLLSQLAIILKRGDSFYLLNASSAVSTMEGNPGPASFEVLPVGVESIMEDVRAGMRAAAAMEEARIPRPQLVPDAPDKVEYEIEDGPLADLCPSRYLVEAAGDEFAVRSMKQRLDALLKKAKTKRKTIKRDLWQYVRENKLRLIFLSKSVDQRHATRQLLDIDCMADWRANRLYSRGLLEPYALTVPDTEVDKELCLDAKEEPPAESEAPPEAALSAFMRGNDLFEHIWTEKDLKEANKKETTFFLLLSSKKVGEKRQISYAFLEKANCKLNVPINDILSSRDEYLHYIDHATGVCRNYLAVLTALRRLFVSLHIARKKAKQIVVFRSSSEMPLRDYPVDMPVGLDDILWKERFEKYFPPADEDRDTVHSTFIGNWNEHACNLAVFQHSLRALAHDLHQGTEEMLNKFLLEYWSVRNPDPRRADILRRKLISDLAADCVRVEASEYLPLAQAKLAAQFILAREQTLVRLWVDRRAPESFYAAATLELKDKGNLHWNTKLKCHMRMDPTTKDLKRVAVEFPFWKEIDGTLAGPFLVEDAERAFQIRETMTELNTQMDTTNEEIAEYQIRGIEAKIARVEERRRNGVEVSADDLSEVNIYEGLVMDSDRYYEQYTNYERELKDLWTNGTLRWSPEQDGFLPSMYDPRGALEARLKSATDAQKLVEQQIADCEARRKDAFKLAKATQALLDASKDRGSQKHKDNAARLVALNELMAVFKEIMDNYTDVLKARQEDTKAAEANLQQAGKVQRKGQLKFDAGRNGYIFKCETNGQTYWLQQSHTEAARWGDAESAWKHEPEFPVWNDSDGLWSSPYVFFNTDAKEWCCKDYYNQSYLYNSATRAWYRENCPHEIALPFHWDMTVGQVREALAARSGLFPNEFKFDLDDRRLVRHTDSVKYNTNDSEYTIHTLKLYCSSWVHWGEATRATELELERNRELQAEREARLKARLAQDALQTTNKRKAAAPRVVQRVRGEPSKYAYARFLEVINGYQNCTSTDFGSITNYTHNARNPLGNPVTVFRQGRFTWAKSNLDRHEVLHRFDRDFLMNHLADVFSGRTRHDTILTFPDDKTPGRLELYWARTIAPVPLPPDKDSMPDSDHVFWGPTLERRAEHLVKFVNNARNWYYDSTNHRCYVFLFGPDMLYLHPTKSPLKEEHSKTLAKPCLVREMIMLRVDNLAEHSESYFSTVMDTGNFHLMRWYVQLAWEDIERAHPFPSEAYDAYCAFCKHNRPIPREHMRTIQDILAKRMKDVDSNHACENYYRWVAKQLKYHTKERRMRVDVPLEQDFTTLRHERQFDVRRTFARLFKDKFGFPYMQALNNPEDMEAVLDVCPGFLGPDQERASGRTAMPLLLDAFYDNLKEEWDKKKFNFHTYFYKEYAPEYARRVKPTMEEGEIGRKELYQYIKRADILPWLVEAYGRYYDNELTFDLGDPNAVPEPEDATEESAGQPAPQGGGSDAEPAEERAGAPPPQGGGSDAEAAEERAGAPPPQDPGRPADRPKGRRKRAGRKAWRNKKDSGGGPNRWLHADFEFPFEL